MIQALLFERPHLQELHLINKTFNGYFPEMSGVEAQDYQNISTLPALKVLVLDGYIWDHSLWDDHLWNWSNITHLELKKVDILYFLEVMSPLSLSGLKIFIEKCSSHPEESHYKAKCSLLCGLLKHTTALTELKINCDTQGPELVSTIALNGSLLQTMSLRCSSLFSDFSWTPLRVDQLQTVGSKCPQLMEIEVNLVLPLIPRNLYANSSSTSRIGGRYASTVTRSMSRVQNAQRNAEDTDESQDFGESEAQREVSSWYFEAYRLEKYKKPYLCYYRSLCLEETAKLEGITFDQANDEFMAWVPNHRKEEVATLRDHTYLDPAPTLAGFRNLRRLTIFTKIYHFVTPEPRWKTIARTFKHLQKWLDELLSTKEGATLEEVKFYVDSEVVNEKINMKMDIWHSRYIYAGRRHPDGSAEIRKMSEHGDIS